MTGAIHTSLAIGDGLSTTLPKVAARHGAALIVSQSAPALTTGPQGGSMAISIRPLCATCARRNVVPLHRDDAMCRFTVACRYGMTEFPEAARCSLYAASNPRPARPFTDQSLAREGLAHRAWPALDA